MNTPEGRGRRWRLILGADCDGTGFSLAGEDLAMDQALECLYNRGEEEDDNRQRSAWRAGRVVAKSGTLARRHPTLFCVDQSRSMPAPVVYPGAAWPRRSPSVKVISSLSRP